MSSFGLQPTSRRTWSVSVSPTISYAEYFRPETVLLGEATLRGSSRVVPRYWGVRPVQHQPGTPIIPKSSVRRASHPKGCDDLRKAELSSHCKYKPEIRIPVRQLSKRHKQAIKQSHHIIYWACLESNHPLKHRKRVIG